jgi:hypothetical protein
MRRLPFEDKCWSPRKDWLCTSWERHCCCLEVDRSVYCSAGYSMMVAFPTVLEV